MKALKAVYLRELAAYFRSPIAYVLLVGFLLVSGYFFYAAVAFYSIASLQAMQNPMMMEMNLTDMIVAPLLGNSSVILLFLTPLITMRLLSEEKRAGTLELLLSYPLTDFSVVLGKFLAAWSFFAILVAGNALQSSLLFLLGQPYPPVIICGYLGILLLGAAYLSLGLFFSAVTENQIVAALGGFAGLLLFWIVGWSASVVGPDLGAVLAGLSLGSHFEKLPRGLVDTSDLAYLALFTCFFLFLTIRTLEAKRWKV